MKERVNEQDGIQSHAKWNYTKENTVWRLNQHGAQCFDCIGTFAWQDWAFL
jgi:hypothetical protein